MPNVDTVKSICSLYKEAGIVKPKVATLRHICALSKVVDMYV